MMGILPSEQSIEDALLKHCQPAPARLQVIGEAFLAARDPKKYRSLRPQGRNPSHQTTKGYPDAYVVEVADGEDAVHIVEATLSDWRGHIERSDLLSIGKIRKVASYVLFVLEKRADPLIPQTNSPAEKVEKNESYYRTLLSSAGVPRQQIEFIFLNQLVRELRSTRYAHVLADIGLAVRTPPFERVADLPVIRSVSPSLQEFRDERVVSRKRLGALYDSLRKSTALVLTGLGGVGKTTLGLAIAHRWTRLRRQEAFYVDAKLLEPGLADGVHQMLASMEMYFDTESLFVVDNSHLLAPEMQARLLSLAARKTAPRLLLLARRFSNEYVAGLSVSERSRVSVQPIVVNEEDLLAAYELVARRETGADEIHRPVNEILESWLVAAPDLVLFCESLHASASLIRAGELPEISARDAERQVRATYIDKLPQEEIASLMVIAKLAALEIPASRRSLGGRLPSNLVSRDLLSVTRSDNVGEERYSLPHDNLGALVLANFDSASVDRAWEESLAADVFQAAYVARRLLDAGKIEGARRILDRHRDGIWHFSRTVPPSFAATFDRLFLRAELPTSYRDCLIPLFRDFASTEKSFLTGSSSFLAFVKSVGAAVNGFDEILLEKSSHELSTAMKLVPPLDLVRLLDLSKSLEFKCYSELLRLLGSDAVLAAFANNLIATHPVEVNQALAGLEAASKEHFSHLLKLLDTMKLQRLFDSTRAALQKSSVDILRLKNMIEFLSSTEMRAELADHVARSWNNIAWFTDQYPDIGEHTRLLVGDALRKSEALTRKSRDNPARIAESLLHVLKGATDIETIHRLVDQLKFDVASCIRFWGAPELEIVWKELEGKLVWGSLIAKIREDIQTLACSRISTALARGGLTHLAVAPLAASGAREGVP